MRAALFAAALLIVVVGCGKNTPPAPTMPTASATAEPETYTIRLAPLAVGDRWAEIETLAMSMTVSTSSGSALVQASKLQEKHVEVLEITSRRMSKALVHFRTVRDQMFVAGKRNEEIQPHAGQTYIVERSGDQVTVTRADGGAATVAEVEAVTKTERTFGRPDPLGTMLDGRRVVEGETIEVPAEIAAEMFSDAGKRRVGAMTLTFRGLEGDVAVFAVSLTMSEDSSNGTLEMALSGTARVEADSGRTLGLTINGSLRMDGTVKATGTFDGATTVVRPE
jgi:hypothetical protein